ncbi:hypothetical protein L226DRAFT_514780 [Lentinus tigrinus ALCF2SS1-7]|uniref:uncharacterized protein n=1 Tax=Lentinus tigrinus ALCF2SS1-7 TaxID=1328758 RepID=UPI0011660BCA|nr:hypothetical protein L226DRAFT_514780 [Lentinus tigrinus ALCF2SS1-7]
MFTTLSSILLALIAGQSSYAAPSASSQIQWGACDPPYDGDPSLVCAFLNVPLDYNNPSVGVANIALAKASAIGPRIGSVFLNPGGPGGPGVQAVTQFKDELLALTGGVYDVVSWDPRGVGKTTPGDVYCFDSVEEYNTFFNGTIELTGIEETGNFTDPVDIVSLLLQAPIMQLKYEVVGAKCLLSSNGKYLRYIGTAAAVRDMVSIANIIDGPNAPINYIGGSYGTLLGAWFVNMFPERVGRVLLDGVLDPVFYATQELATHWASHQLVSADTIYKGLITGCALAGPAGCAVASEGDGPLDIDAKFQALLKAAYDATRANASVPVTLGQIRTTLYGEMYTPSSWSNFTNVIWPELAAMVKGESPPGKRSTYTPGLKSMFPPTPWAKDQASDTPSYTTSAIFCADSVDTQGTSMAEIFEAVIAATQKVSHIFGSGWPNPVAYPCSFWPVRSVERYTGPFNKKLPNKILVASSMYDPITPLTGAQALASLLGDSAVLVRSSGFGHTTLNEPSTCMNEIMIAYFVNGTLPANNRLCEVDESFEVFDGVTTADIIAHLPDVDV